MKEITEFRKKISEKNIYFSIDMENALKSYGYETDIIPLFHKNRIIGFATNHIKRQGISVPPPLFPFYGLFLENDFLVKHPETSMSMIKDFTRIQRNKFLFSLFALPPEIKDIRALKQNGWNENVKYTYRLFAGENVLKSSKYRKIKNIDGEFSISNAKNTDTLYQLILKMNKYKNRVTPYKPEYLSLIFKNLPEESRTVYEIHDKDNNCIASALILRDTCCSYLFANAIDETARNGNINLFFLKGVIERELRINPCFDLQGANTPSIVKFKENFNTHLTQYFHIKIGFDITSLIKIKGNIKRWLSR